MALGLGLGIPLAWQGWAGWQGRPSSPFSPARTGWLRLLALLVVLLVLGGIVTLLSLIPTLLLPPVHVLVMALLPLMVLYIVGGALRGRGGSWRDVIAGLASGGFLGIGLSIVGEILVALVAIIALTIVAATVPGGQERITELAELMQNPAWQADPMNILRLFSSPVVIIAALGMFSIPVPLIEEACKTLAAGLAGRWIRPHPARAFLWGVAGGAGFALAENLFNGALGGTESWAVSAVARFGATVMHCFTGGLIGWGWGQLWTARRPWRLIGAYVFSVIVHSIWNAVAIGMAFLGVSVVLHEGNPAWMTLAGLGVMILFAMLGSLTAGFIVALVLGGQKLATQEEATQVEMYEEEIVDSAESLAATEVSTV
jgi:hypothetical protein